MTVLQRIIDLFAWTRQLWPWSRFPTPATTTRPEDTIDDPATHGPGATDAPATDTPNNISTLPPTGNLPNPGGKSGSEACPAGTTPPENTTNASNEHEEGTSNPPPRGSSDTPRDPPPTDNSTVEAGTEITNGGAKKPPKAPRQIPGKRGGAAPPGPPNTSATATPRPELVCRRAPNSHLWEIVLSADKECSIENVAQNGKPLNITNREWRVPSLTAPLDIDIGNGKSDKFPLFDGQNPLIFKLRSDWKGDGRRLRRITSGCFIVIAPEGWKRTGGVPVESDACVDANFRAHYFFRDTHDTSSETGGFVEYGDMSSDSRIHLGGDRVFDDCDLGELFGGKVPELKNTKSYNWVRVGEERKNGWSGENFKPSEKALHDILNGRQGRFFIRVYDRNIKLQDSDEFRYLRDLREIRVNGERYAENTVLAPSSAGHTPTSVRFIGSNGVNLFPILAPETRHVEVQENGSLVVAPDPDVRRVSCALETDNGRVDIVLNLPFIWWRLERSEGEPEAWSATPVTMTRQEFRIGADTREAMQLRLPRSCESVYVGFDDEINRGCPAEKDDDSSKHVRLPLDHFVDHSQMDGRLYEDVSFRVKIGEIVVPLIRILADPVPEIVSFTCQPSAVAAGKPATLRWETRNSEVDGVRIDPSFGPVEACGSQEIEPSVRTTYSLNLAVVGCDDISRAVTVDILQPPPTGGKPVARVKGAGGRWRSGKGFSCDEIRTAGSTADDMRGTIPIDKRRRTSHQFNVESIRRSSDG